jgi:hypothetical protein
MRIHRCAGQAFLVLLPIFGFGCSDRDKAHEPVVGSVASRMVQKEADGSIGLSPTGPLSAETYDWRSSVALVGHKPFLKRKSDGTATLDTVEAIKSAQHLGAKDLWPDTPLVANERAVWQAATGWLAAPDLFVTAAHVLNSGPSDKCGDVTIVFTDGKPVEGSYDGAQVYGCSRVVARGPWRGLDPDENDWVVLQLDRPAAGRKPLPVGQLQPGQPVSTAGHPLGIRQHTSVGGVALPLPADPQLMALSLTGISGQSGAPIVTTADGSIRVVGMLVGSRSDDTFVNEPRLQPDGTMVTRETWSSVPAQTTRASLGLGIVPQDYTFALSTIGPVAQAIANGAALPTEPGYPARTLGTTCASRVSAYLGNAATNAYTAMAEEGPSAPTMKSDWVYLRENDRAHYQFGSQGDQAFLRIEMHPSSRSRVDVEQPALGVEVDARLSASTTSSGALKRHWKAPADGWYRAVVSDVLLPYGSGARGRVDFVAREAFQGGDDACQPSTCFGAVGPDCEGVAVPNNVVNAVSDRLASINELLQLLVPYDTPAAIEPCKAIAGGTIECSVSVASQKHDSCCALNPTGFLCGSQMDLGASACRDEFIDAVADVGRREVWRVRFDPTDFWYLGERTLLGQTSGPRSRNAMLAPEGTVLQKSAVDDGWCGTLGAEDELPSLPGKPSIPGVTDRKRCRNVLQWGDSTFRGLDGGTLVSATATSGSLQAALLRTIPLGAPAELGLGFQKLGQQPLDLTGGPNDFTIGEKTNASGWSVRAMEPGGVTAANPGRYELTFFSTAPLPAARYTNDKPEWRDGNLSPLMVAPRLDKIVSQNYLSDHFESFKVPIEVESQILSSVCKEDSVFAGCEMPAATYSDDSKGTTLCVNNTTDAPVSLYWVDYGGNPVFLATYEKDGGGCWSTVDTHSFVLYGRTRCLGGLKAQDPGFTSSFKVTSLPPEPDTQTTCK